MTEEARSAARRIFWQHHGSLAQLAKELGISTAQLNLWFRRGIGTRSVAPDAIDEAVRRGLEAFEG